MFYQYYYKQQLLRNKIRDILENKQAKENQAIDIRDLVVYSSSHKYSFGEVNHSNTSPYHWRLRLIDHIEMLASIANEYHEKFYCNFDAKTNSYTIKPDCLNKITRICLSEFALYAKNPNSLREFGFIVDAIEAIARNQLPNVHLLLSSIAVINSENELINVSLYVQCGDNPKIQVCTKGSDSATDISYGKRKNFSQNNISSPHLANISAFIGSKNLVISNSSVFLVETHGGAKYIQAVDICLDHDLGHSKKLFTQLLTSEIKQNPFIIPSQVDHILTSNWIAINQDSNISTKILYVDAKMTRDYVKHIKNDPLDDLSKFKKNKYSQLKLHKTARGILIENPPFGSSYMVAVQEERKLGGYWFELKSDVEKRNLKVKEFLMQSWIEKPHFSPREFFNNSKQELSRLRLCN